MTYLVVDAVLIGDRLPKDPKDIPPQPVLGWKYGAEVRGHDIHDLVDTQ